MSDQLTFTNPVTRFPDITPPRQDQPGPGLDAELIPGTGRGDESYRGDAVAPAYVFLTSSESSCVLGETLAVTGGSPTP